MGRGKKAVPDGLKVTFTAISAPTGGRGIFGIEEETDAIARQAKLLRMAERIAVYARGCEGGRRRCPRYGQWQKYKGEVSRELVVDCGTLTVRRAYYVCLGCRERWIWNLVEALVPHAIPILDFSHVKHYLWDAGKILYGDGSAFVPPWVKDQEALLLENNVAQVIAHLQYFLDLRLALAAMLHYFQQHAARMCYGGIYSYFCL